MTVYSHSRLSCYEQCPARYKLHYLDRTEVEIPDTIETFLGSRVHETLEKLYRDLEYQKMNSLEDLLYFLRDQWEKQWSDDILIVKNEYTAENYRLMAEKYISDYYKRYYPFNQSRTIALEERITINLDEEGMYKLQGFIDRLSETADGFYEIHDYKTNSRLPLTEYIESDRQLALYMIGVKKQYPKVKDVRLIWHFLKFDKEVDSTRTDAELEQLKNETIRLIDQIESDTVFKALPSYRCEWCEYQHCCSQWMHRYKIQEKPANEYLQDTGVQLVDRYAELKVKQKRLYDELEHEIAKLEEVLISFASKENIDCVFGSKNKVRITTQEKLVFPPKNTNERRELESMLRKLGKFDEVIQLDTAALNKIITEKQWDSQVIAAVMNYLSYEQKKRLYLSTIKEK
ncbi:MAG: PD-(D/E)XK nuclease family protein [Candidatus Thermoplasmatota archaeon]